ncbi:MAG: ComEC/Rec2 family competence protein, partial [Thermonemataceae bacterium]|nr:ComEC/Rec2 family competence protein [Thermonemataceae bacterium]
MKLLKFLKSKWEASPKQQEQPPTDFSGLTFVRFLLFLLIGILLGKTFPVYNDFLVYGWGCLLLIYLLISFFSPKRYKVSLQPAIAVLAYMCVGIFGALVVHFRNESNISYHLLSQEEGFSHYQAKIISEVVEKPKTYHFVCQIQGIKKDKKWEKSISKANIFLEKGNKKPQFGDIFVATNHLQLIPTPLNTYQFDYRKYLSYQNIYHQQYIKQEDYLKLKTDIPWYKLFESAAIRIRQYCDKAIKNFVESEQESGMASALVLGVKHHLDEDLKQAYTNAGVTHVLAVSGMHVGILYWILSKIFAFLKERKNGKLPFMLMVLLILWLYAFITGLSGSVLRAVAMFSLIVIAQNTQKNVNIYNTLAVSAFFLLVWNPFLLFDVGFQLSYLAVLGIVYLFPKWYPYYEANNILSDWIWKTTIVSIAAQLFTLPITLYHFHQYPTYGIFANLLIIPLGNVVLLMGLALLVVSFLPYIPEILGWFLEKTIWLTNKIVFGVENLDYATTSFVLNIEEAILLSIFLLSIILFFEKKRFYFGIFAGLTMVLLSINSIYQNYQQKQQAIFAVYGIPNAWACSLTEGTRTQIWTDSSLEKSVGRLNFNTKNLLDELGTQEKHYHQKPSMENFGAWEFWVWRKNKIIFIQKAISLQDWLKINTLKAEYLIIQNNAVKNLKKLTYQPYKIVVDASNKTYIAENLAKENNKV